MHASMVLRLWVFPGTNAVVIPLLLSTSNTKRRKFPVSNGVERNPLPRTVTPIPLLLLLRPLVREFHYPPAYRSDAERAQTTTMWSAPPGSASFWSCRRCCISTLSLESLKRRQATEVGILNEIRQKDYIHNSQPNEETQIRDRRLRHKTCRYRVLDQALRKLQY